MPSADGKPGSRRDRAAPDAAARIAGIAERFRHSTRAQIAAAPVGLLAAALIVTSAALLIALYTATEREQDAALIDQAKAVANDFLDGDNQVVSSDLPHETREGVPVDTVVVSPA